MPKRRNVIMGLGALVFGSGATTMSGAFDSAFASPDADLRVIADAQLRVRSARDSSGTPIVKSETTTTEADLSDSSNLVISDRGGLSTDFSSFYTNQVDEPEIESPGKPEVAALEINEGRNEDLGIRTAITNRLDGEFDPLLEVTNNTGSAYKIRINYAENVDSSLDQIVSGGPNGYGSDVNDVEGTSGEYNVSGSSTVSRKDVQEIYQFKMTSEDPSEQNSVGSSGNNTLISPDPSDDGTSNPADEGANSYQLGNGETAFIKLDFDTTGNVSEINSSVHDASNPFVDNADLNLLNEIYLTAE